MTQRGYAETSGADLRHTAPQYLDFLEFPATGIPEFPLTLTLFFITRINVRFFTVASNKRHGVDSVPPFCEVFAYMAGSELRVQNEHRPRRLQIRRGFLPAVQ